MAKINVLEPNVFNLIAAGEVVERPVSVVKELVENSIDAGAKNIKIEVSDGGIKMIRVSDDGCGIEEDDVKKAFLPHATSKIKNASDLDSIKTLGFRGEALASIASVAKVTLISKTEGSELGTKVFAQGGIIGETEKVGCPSGTTICVEDLFFCVPARAKFLKKPKSEEQEITGIIIRTILAHPEINFTYVTDGKKNLSSLGSSPVEALYSVYGKQAVDETISVSAKRDGVSVSGFVGRPTFSKSNRTYQTLIINGRYVVNTTIQSAVSNAYGDFLMKRQYPFFVLYLTIPSDEIDVNVHPNKLDVRFLKSSLVYSVVFEAVSRGLLGMDYVKEVYGDEDKNLTHISINKSESAKIDKAGVNLNPFSANFEKMSRSDKDKISDIVIDSMLDKNQENGVRDNFGLGSKLLERINEKVKTDSDKAFDSDNYSVDELGNKKETIFEQKKENIVFVNDKNPEIATFHESFSAEEDGIFKMVDEKPFIKPKTIQQDFAEDKITIVGKFFNTYLAIEWGDSIYMIDQHAAHERIRYEKLKSEVESGKLVIQPMLVPFVISVSPEDDEIINANIEAIRSVGFDIDEFGDRTYKISSIPAIISDIDFNEFFRMFLAEKLGKNKITKSELLKDTLMQMACKSAVKGGDDLTKNEIDKLLYEMSEKNIVLFCPHGRPVVVRITKSEIEKWFRRIV